MKLVPNACCRRCSGTSRARSADPGPNNAPCDAARTTDVATNHHSESAKAQLTVASTSPATSVTYTGTGPNRSVMVPIRGEAASPTRALTAKRPVAKATEKCRMSWT